MGIAERRGREKEALRIRIVEAARDIVSEAGLDALSMRAIAERIEYSPGTIYLYFRDKNELLGEVIQAGFERMGEYIEAEFEAAGEEASPAVQHRALGRAYAKFGIENTAYFRVMFELPTAPHHCGPEEVEVPREGPCDTLLVDVVQRAIDAGAYTIQDADTGAVIAWGLIHGLTSLYLAGHLSPGVSSNESFLDLLESAMDALGSGWTPRETGAEKMS